MATKVKAKASSKKKAAVGARKVKSAPRKKRVVAGDSGSIVEKALRRGRTSTSRVSSKNQVTIPVDILRKAGLKEGDEVSFAVNENGKLEVTREVGKWDDFFGFFSDNGIFIDYKKEHAELWGE